MHLNAILSALVIDARLHPGKFFKRTLAHGLTIGVRISKDKQGNLFTLFASRKDEPPSRKEWQTILEALNQSYYPPQPKLMQPAGPIIYGTTQFLKAEWYLEPEQVPSRSHAPSSSRSHAPRGNTSPERTHT